MSSMQHHNAAVVWSVALHIAVIAGLAVGIDLPDRPRVAVAAAPIQGVIVDSAALRRDQAVRDAAARQERQRQQRAEQQRREAAEQQKLAEQREQQRTADAARAREQAAEAERDRVAAAKREQEQVAREQREREAREKAERDAAARRERDAAAEQRRREAELQAAVDLDRERAEAEAAGLLDVYKAQLEDAIKDEWNRPLSARPGIVCFVEVVQLPTGDVMSARVTSCNGDDAVRRSIEQAVRDASPLPEAPDPTLFQRVVNVRFKPDE
jgi:colicin import membrane protein